RTADASVDLLDRAPPAGIHHHFARLAVVTFPDGVTDCRTLWPPPVQTGDHGCDCTVCVSAEQHNAGTLTLQHAIDQVKDSGGTVCLGIGLYVLTKPLAIAGAKSLRLHGQGTRTVLFNIETQSALAIDDSMDVVVENMALLGKVTAA